MNLFFCCAVFVEYLHEGVVEYVPGSHCWGKPKVDAVQSDFHAHAKADFKRAMKQRVQEIVS